MSPEDEFGKFVVDYIQFLRDIPAEDLTNSLDRMWVRLFKHDDSQQVARPTFILKKTTSLGVHHTVFLDNYYLIFKNVTYAESDTFKMNLHKTGDMFYFSGNFAIDGIPSELPEFKVPVLEFGINRQTSHVGFFSSTKTYIYGSTDTYSQFSIKIQPGDITWNESDFSVDIPIKLEFVPMSIISPSYDVDSTLFTKSIEHGFKMRLYFGSDGSKSASDRRGQATAYSGLPYFDERFLDAFPEYKMRMCNKSIGSERIITLFESSAYSKNAAKCENFMKEEWCKHICNIYTYKSDGSFDTYSPNGELLKHISIGSIGDDAQIIQVDAQKVLLLVYTNNKLESCIITDGVKGVVATLINDVRHSRPVFYGSNIYVTTGSNIHAFDLLSSVDKFNGTVTTALVEEEGGDDVILITDEILDSVPYLSPQFKSTDGTTYIGRGAFVYVISNLGYLHAYNGQTGTHEQKCNLDTNGYKTSALYHSVYFQRIYVITDNILHVIDRQGDASLLRKFKGNVDGTILNDELVCTNDEAYIMYIGTFDSKTDLFICDTTTFKRISHKMDLKIPNPTSSNFYEIHISLNNDIHIVTDSKTILIGYNPKDKKFELKWTNTERVVPQTTNFDYAGTYIRRVVEPDTVNIINKDNGKRDSYDKYEDKDPTSFHLSTDDDHKIIKNILWEKYPSRGIECACFPSVDPTMFSTVDDKREWVRQVMTSGESLFNSFEEKAFCVNPACASARAYKIPNIVENERCPSICMNVINVNVNVPGAIAEVTDNFQTCPDQSGPQPPAFPPVLPDGSITPEQPTNNDKKRPELNSPIYEYNTRIHPIWFTLGVLLMTIGLIVIVTWKKYLLGISLMIVGGVVVPTIGISREYLYVHSIHNMSGNPIIVNHTDYTTAEYYIQMNRVIDDDIDLNTLAKMFHPVPSYLKLDGDGLWVDWLFSDSTKSGVVLSYNGSGLRSKDSQYTLQPFTIGTIDIIYPYLFTIDKSHVVLSTNLGSISDIYFNDVVRGRVPDIIISISNGNEIESLDGTLPHYASVLDYEYVTFNKSKMFVYSLQLLPKGTNTIHVPPVDIILTSGDVIKAMPITINVKEPPLNEITNDGINYVGMLDDDYIYIPNYKVGDNVPYIENDITDQNLYTIHRKFMGVGAGAFSFDQNMIGTAYEYTVSEGANMNYYLNRLVYEVGTITFIEKQTFAAMTNNELVHAYNQCFNAYSYVGKYRHSTSIIARPMNTSDDMLREGFTFKTLVDENDKINDLSELVNAFDTSKITTFYISTENLRKVNISLYDVYIANFNYPFSYTEPPVLPEEVSVDVVFRIK